MRIIDIPEFKDKSQVVTFDESTPLHDAIQDMAKNNYGAVLVTKKDKLAGIFTERDLLCRVAAHDLNLKKTKLREVMTTDLKTARQTDPIADCMRRMSHGRFRHMPVVDDENNILGMLSQGDFVAFTMGDIMERLGHTAKVNFYEGQNSPLLFISAIFVYTLGLLIILSGFDHWFGS